jgi:hypothetical protein
VTVTFESFVGKEERAFGLAAIEVGEPLGRKVLPDQAWQVNQSALGRTGVGAWALRAAARARAQAREREEVTVHGSDDLSHGELGRGVAEHVAATLTSAAFHEALA